MSKERQLPHVYKSSPCFLCLRDSRITESDSVLSGVRQSRSFVESLLKSCYSLSWESRLTQLQSDSVLSG